MPRFEGAVRIVFQLVTELITPHCAEVDTESIFRIHFGGREKIIGEIAGVAGQCVGDGNCTARKASLEKMISIEDVRDGQQRTL